MYQEEFPREVQLDTINNFTNYNPFAFETNNQSSSKAILFYQTVQNFYLQEPIAAHSTIRGECSLFLSREGNFVNIM